MTPAELRDVVDQVDLGDPNLEIRLGEDFTYGFSSGLWLQVRHLTLPSNLAGGRKWRISSWATEGEVVQTCLMALLAWYEHEARESFTYKGVPVFSPHFDLDVLVRAAQCASFEHREAVPA